MILDCPACRARFNVADHLIPEAGRIVRCSKCTHEWFVQKPTAPKADDFDPLRDLVPSPKPEEAAFAPEIPFDDAPKTASAPDPARRRFGTAMHRRSTDREAYDKWLKPLKIAVPLLAASWALLAAFTYFPSWSQAPGLGGIYRAFGVNSLEGLAFAEVEMQREQEGNKTRFILSGNVHNRSTEERLLPTVRVELRDKTNRPIWSREYAVNKSLKAGETYPFRITNVETAFAKSITSIVVDMGNAVQLMVR